MSVAPQNNARIEILRDRARQLQAVRTFFEERHVIEVDCPHLSRGAALDAHIDLFVTDTGQGALRYLHSSPEFAMKRLLAMGMGDIYQLGHVFRFSELSPKHQPEFTMVEWYRKEVAFASFMDETLEMIQVLLGVLPKNQLTYREAFLRYTELDPFQASLSELLQFLENQGIKSYSSGNLDNLDQAQARDDLLNQILGLFIEPHLGWETQNSGLQNSKMPCLTILSHYPASQAALAQTVIQEGNHVAERFEVYCQGLELANGYHELASAKEQALRFDQTNQLRQQLGKEPLPIDGYFLEALEQGLPECCGVAVGFDRLMMLRHKTDCIAQILPLSWEET